MILSDLEIKRRCLQSNMIDPFIDHQISKNDKGEKVISYGVSSYGYDLRLGYEFKLFTNLWTSIIDVKQISAKSYITEITENYIILPPNSFALATSIEHFKIPRDILAICLGKSSWARAGLIINVTPLEPEWEGQVTIGISNSTTLPAKLYAGEGIGQIIFLQADEICQTSYKDKGGKYQGQMGVTLPEMNEMFKTERGKVICADSRQYLPTIESDSVDLLFFSPPYGLLDRKSYLNPTAEAYKDWFFQFVPDFYRILKDTGSMVINIGGAWNSNSPTRSLYQYKLLIDLCEEYTKPDAKFGRWWLCQDVTWFVPSRLTTTEWASRRKIRLRDSTEMVWWMAKTEFPTADVSKVLMTYSNAYQKFLNQDIATRNLMHSKSHSGLEISGKNLKDNSGRIATNMLYISTSESNEAYFEGCRAANLTPHPARFPKALPEFFINLLTSTGSMVVDPFAGSLTTGWVAEQLDRRWLNIELSREFILGGLTRFNKKTSNQKPIF